MKRRYTVRKMTSGWDGVSKFYVWDLVKKDRPSLNRYFQRDAAQIEADNLEVSDMVRPHAEDPRPYEVRLAEAQATFNASKK